MFFLQIKYFTNWLFTMQNSNFKKVFLIFFLCFLGNYVSWAAKREWRLWSQSVCKKRRKPVGNGV